MNIPALNEFPHEWPKGSVVLIVYPPGAGRGKGEGALVLVLSPQESDQAAHAFNAVLVEVKPEVIVMFTADGQPDGRHLLLATYPQLPNAN